MTTEITFHLHTSFFGETEQPLTQSGELTAAAFLYPSRLQALRLSNAEGSIVVLPF